MRYLLALLVVCSTLDLWGQASEYTIVGSVVEASTGQTIDYATVVLMDKTNQEMLTGTTTEEGGRFRLKTSAKEVQLEVSFIGYDKVVMDLNLTGLVTKLDPISLGENAATLDEIVVTAQKSTTEFKLDKRVFNVGSDLSNTGASALEVLNNVPSVNVSIEGEVTLRGSSGVQILINGKPSVLASEESNALGTITADMLESVEVITNPSAKYEAEGTAGIINLVMKKNEKKGLVGSVSLNTGLPQNHSLGFSVSKRTENFNLFTQMGVGYKELITDSENFNTNFRTDETVSSIGEEFRNEKFYNLVIGTDYYINPTNVITLSGSFAYEIEDQPSEFDFNLTDGSDASLFMWNRTEVTEATNPKLQYELQYNKDFEDHKEHKLAFSAIGNYFGKDQSSVFSEALISGMGNLSNQTTATEFEEGKFTFNLDYTKPFNDQWQIETGVQYLVNNVSNDFTVSDEIDGVLTVNPGLTNVFEYDQNVLGVYGTGSFEGTYWGLKLGLRVENTDLNTLLVNTGERNPQNFTNLFPSAHTSYKFTDRISFQAGYSRRIYRPRLWDLNPFFNIRNNFNVRAGNPNLLPEFTDSYEVGAIFIYENITFNTSIYHRYTTEVIERVATFENNVNVFAPLNIGTENTTGVELNFKYSPAKSVTFNGNVNYNYFSRQGEFSDQVFDFSNDQWSSKLTGKFKLHKSLDLEATGQYNSDVQTVQGTRFGNLFADFGARYKINGGKSVVSLSVRDVFASRVRESISAGPDFETYSFRQRGRFITLGYSYSFGKGEAIEFRGGGRRR
jgi:outer membrane receptor protein involved in Fe transport